MWVRVCAWQLEACRSALDGFVKHDKNRAVFDVSAHCQEAVRHARIGLAARPEAVTSGNRRRSIDLQARVMRRPSLPWDKIVTHFNDANSDAVSGRHHSFSGQHTLPISYAELRRQSISAEAPGASRIDE